MSLYTFLASDSPLPTVKAPAGYPLDINVDTGVIYDGDADDNFSLYKFRDVELYTGKKYGVWLEWRYTDGRAEKLIQYIRENLNSTDSIELWHVWLTDYYEYDERPVIHKKTVSIDRITVVDIKELVNREVWKNRDSARPHHYCIEIVK